MSEHPTRDDLRDLLSLAAPVVFVQVGLMAMGVVDTIVVGRVSADALAAVALGNMYFMTVAILGMGVLFALDPVISQAVGADDSVGVARGVQRGVVLALAWCVPSVLPLALAGRVFEALGQPAEVVPIAHRYVIACIPGLPAFLLFVVLRQSLQALGRLRPVVYSIVAGNVINLFLNWVFVYGNLGSPPLGAIGSGIATTIGRFAMVGLLLAFAWKHVARILFPFRPEAVDAAPLMRMLRLGIPIGIQFVLEVGVFSLVGILMGRWGAIPLAGHQVALNLASFTFMVPLGVSASAAVVVGRAVGRRDPPGARRSARLALALSATFMTLSALTLLLIPHVIASGFTRDANVIAIAAALIPVAGVFQIFDGFQVTAGGILRGVGDTKAPLIANLVGYWVLGFPVSLWLGFSVGLGPPGLWWGFVVGLATVAVFLTWRVRTRLRHLPEPLAIDGAPPGAPRPAPIAVAEHPAG